MPGEPRVPPSALTRVELMDGSVDAQHVRARVLQVSVFRAGSDLLCDALAHCIAETEGELCDALADAGTPQFVVVATGMHNPEWWLAAVLRHLRLWRASVRVVEVRPARQRHDDRAAAVQQAIVAQGLGVSVAVHTPAGAPTPGRR